MRKSAAILNDAKLGNNIYTTKSPLTNKPTIETLKKVLLMFKVNNKTPERLSTVFSGNFGHTSLHVLVLLQLTWNIHNILLQLLTDAQKF